MAHWQLLADRDLYSNFILRLHLETIRTPSGLEADWTVVDVLDGAAVVPIADDGRVCLIRQYRQTAGFKMWELPAGRIEPEESPACAAERELREEAGFDACQFSHLTTIYPLAGIVRHRVHIYMATGLVDVPHRREPFEEIEIAMFSRDEIHEMLEKNEISCAIAIAGLSRWLMSK